MRLVLLLLGGVFVTLTQATYYSDIITPLSNLGVNRRLQYDREVFDRSVREGKPLYKKCTPQNVSIRREWYGWVLFVLAI
jgi:succinate dehydrogenase/fumarate reductase-like Fe-S protein